MVVVIKKSRGEVTYRNTPTFVILADRYVLGLIGTSWITYSVLMSGIVIKYGYYFGSWPNG